MEKNVLDQLSQIVDGWKNLIIADSTTEELAKRRMTICLLCEHYKNTSKRCGICKCYMPAGVRANKKKCPKGKW